MDLGRLEFRYAAPPKDQKVLVAVNSQDYYTKTLAFFQALLEKLKEAIPFDYEIVDEPKVEVLGGRRISGMASVEMGIRFKISDTEALSKLKAKEFWEGFEVTR